MADETTPTAGGEAMAGQAPQSGSQPPFTQSRNGQGDKLAGILAKQQAGQALTASERGYLGGIKRKQANKAAVPPANSNPLFVASPSPENPLFEAVAGNPAPVQAAVNPAPDPALLRRTADAVLSSCDTITKLIIGHQAKKAGADKETVEEYKKAVELQPENRKLIVDNSETAVSGLCNVMGVGPDKLFTVLQGSGLVAGIVAHVACVSTALAAINERAKERAKLQSQQPKTT